jgi:uncharacterized OB-fold protein
MNSKLIDNASGRYLPIQYPEEATYWEAAKRHVLMLQRCNGCGKAWYPIGPTCPFCLSADYEWEQMSGRGVISNVVVFHKGWTEYLKKKAPYAVIQVELEEGPRLTANFLGDLPGPENIGMPVEAVWEDLTEEVSLVQFRARAS